MLTTLGGTLKVTPIDLGEGACAPELGDEFALRGLAGWHWRHVRRVSICRKLARDSNGTLLSRCDVSALTVVEASETLAGDYNDDGTVDAADYTVWRDSLASGTPLLNETGASASSTRMTTRGRRISVQR